MEERGWPDARLDVLAPGHPFTVPAPLFRKLTDDDVAAYKERFGGA